MNARVSLFALCLVVLGGGRAESSLPPKVISCKNPREIGYYEQCQEVVIRKDLGDKVLAYSTASSHVDLFPKSSLFLPHLAKNSEAIAAKQLIVLSAEYIWNTSSPGYFSLCRVEGKPKDQVLTITCNTSEQEHIHQSKVLLLKPY